MTASSCYGYPRAAPAPNQLMADCGTLLQTSTQRTSITSPAADVNKKRCGQFRTPATTRGNAGASTCVCTDPPPLVKPLPHKAHPIVRTPTKVNNAGVSHGHRRVTPAPAARRNTRCVLRICPANLPTILSANLSIDRPLAPPTHARARPSASWVCRPGAKASMRAHAYANKPFAAGCIKRERPRLTAKRDHLSPISKDTSSQTQIQLQCPPRFPSSASTGDCVCPGGQIKSAAPKCGWRA